MRKKELPVSVQKDIQADQRLKHLSELEIKSYYGAVSAFAVLQIFGYIIYQGFKFYGFSSTLLFPGFYFIVFLYIQGSVLRLIQLYFAGNKIPSPKSVNLKTGIKLVIGMLAIIVFILFEIGYYPFPKQNSTNFFEGIIYQAFSWFVSWVVANNERWKNIYFSRVGTQTGPRRTWIMVFCAAAFFVSLSRPEFFYVFSAIPLGAFIILLTSWLVESEN